MKRLSKRKRLLYAALFGGTAVILTHLTTSKQERFEYFLKKIRKRKRDANAHANTVYHQYDFDFERTAFMPTRWFTCFQSYHVHYLVDVLKLPPSIKLSNGGRVPADTALAMTLYYLARPHGIVYDFAGPFSVRSANGGIYKESMVEARLNDMRTAYSDALGRDPVIYGDQAYAYSEVMERRANADLDDAATRATATRLKRINERNSSSRIIVEWAFMQMTQAWKSLEQSQEDLRLLQMPVASTIRVCMFLTNVRSFLYPSTNRGSNFLNCPTGSFEDYIASFERIPDLPQYRTNGMAAEVVDSGDQESEQEP